MFKQLKVVELANVLAGPSVGMFFAELGAQVIKIENQKTGGDLTRKWKLPEENANSSISAYFASINWGKHLLLLDLTTSEGKEKVYNLIKEADVVISNFKFGDDKKLGVNYEQLKAINPRIICGKITGFPEGDSRVAYDVVLQAESGFMSMNGNTESGPLKMPVALIDILTAHQLKEGILIALLKREKTGKGSLVSVSLYETAVASLANQATNYLMSGVIPKRLGNLHPNIAPYGEIVTTKDGIQIVLAVGTDQQFSALCQVLNATELSIDNRFTTNPQRVKNRIELLPELTAKFNTIEWKAIKNELLKINVPFGEVKSLDQVFIHPDNILVSSIENEPTKRVKTNTFKLSE